MRVKTEDLITREECLTREQFISKKVKGYYVYFLIDPFSYQIKYVGKGSGNRCLDHFKFLEDSNKRKSAWLRKLAKRDREPLYVIWESYNEEKLCFEQESNLIYMFGRRGQDKGGTLLNIQNDTVYQGGKSLGLDIFVKKAKEVHGDKYCYENSVYQGVNNFIDIKCLKHGIYSQKASSHIHGKSGCPKCAGNQVLTLGEFKELCDKDKVSQTEFLSNYEGMSYYMEFKCKKHNKIYTQTAENFKLGNGCQECIAENKRVQFSLGMKKYVSSLPKEFKEHFIYKGDYVNMHTEIEIECKQCGDSFYQKPLHHKSLKICRACNKRIYDENNS